MTTYSTFYTCEICPNYDELNDTLAYGDLGSLDRKNPAAEGVP